MSTTGMKYTHDPEQRFLSHVEDGDGCHLWTGPIRDGYGRFQVTPTPGRVKNIAAHRFAWERANGPIPDGMVIDHICMNRSCVNPEHLRLATRAQNNSHLSGARSHNRGTGARNVYRKGGGYVVVIQANGDRYRSRSFSTVEAAAEHAAVKRGELFGSFAGRG